MPKKQDQLTELLEQFKQSNMKPEKMAQIIKGLFELQPKFLQEKREEPTPRAKGRRKTPTPPSRIREKDQQSETPITS